MFLCVGASDALASPAKDSLIRELRSSTSVLERIDLQEKLRLYNDSLTIGLFRETFKKASDVKTQLSALVQLGYIYTHVKIRSDSARWAIGQIREVNQRKTNTNSLVQAELFESELLYMEDRSKRPLTVYRKYSGYFESAEYEGTPEQKLDYYLRISYLFRFTHPDTSGDYLNKALEYNNGRGENPYSLRIKLQLAHVYYALGLFGRGMAELRDIGPKIRINDIPQDLFMYHSMVGFLWTAVEIQNVVENYGQVSDSTRFRIGLLHLDTALLLATRFKYHTKLGALHNNLGIAYDNFGNSEKAIYNYQKAIEFYEKRPRGAVKVCKILGNLTHLEWKRRDYNKAKEYCKLGQNMAIQCGSDLEYELALFGEISLEYDQGDTLLFLELVKQIDPKIFERNYQFATLLEFYDRVYHGYIKTKKYKQALNSRNMYFAFRDSLVIEQERGLIIANQVYEKTERLKADLRKTDLELAVQEEKAEKTKYMFLGLTLIGVLLSVLVFFKISNDKQRLKLNLEVARTSEMRHKLDVLQSQINPHFIFNSMNTIQYLVRSGLEKKSLDYIEDFSSLLRQTLSYSGEDLVQLGRELELLTTYVNLEKVRLEKDIEFRIEVSNGVTVEELAITPMLIQPLLENALWHGLAKTENKGELILRLEKDGMLQVVIEDNGKGYFPNQDTGNRFHKSYGLSNIRRRLDFISDVYSCHCSLYMSNLSSEGKQGTRQVLRLPFIKWTE